MDSIRVWAVLGCKKLSPSDRYQSGAKDKNVGEFWIHGMEIRHNHPAGANDAQRLHIYTYTKNQIILYTHAPVGSIWMNGFLEQVKNSFEFLLFFSMQIYISN